jgi:hypothetical protein
MIFEQNFLIMRNYLFISVNHDNSVDLNQFYGTMDLNKQFPLVHT